MFVPSIFFPSTIYYLHVNIRIALVTTQVWQPLRQLQFWVCGVRAHPSLVEPQWLRGLPASSPFHTGLKSLTSNLMKSIWILIIYTWQLLLYWTWSLSDWCRWVECIFVVGTTTFVNKYIYLTIKDHSVMWNYLIDREPKAIDRSNSDKMFDW